MRKTIGELNEVNARLLKRLLTPKPVTAELCQYCGVNDRASGSLCLKCEDMDNDRDMEQEQGGFEYE